MPDTASIIKASKALADAVSFDVNGINGKGGNGGLTSNDTLRKADELRLTISRFEAAASNEFNEPHGLEFRKTSRGFAISEFEDRYGSKCSLQASSIASEASVWLGVDSSFNGEPSARMHLTQRMVGDLLPALILFFKTGELVSGTGDAE